MKGLSPRCERLPLKIRQIPSITESEKVAHFAISIGTEELAHLEMVGTIVHQLTKNLKDSDIEGTPLAPYYIDHGKGVYPAAAAGQAFDAMAIAVKGDPIADLVEDLAAEQKARVTYENILRVSDDPDVNKVIRYLREREVVHFQRFGEALDRLQSKAATKPKRF